MNNKQFPQFPTMLRKMWTGQEVQDWLDENIIPALGASAQPAEVAAQPLSESEQRYILGSPAALAELLSYHDWNHCHAASVLEGEEIPAWPPARWTDLREKGRKVIEEDPECFSPELLRTFGFDAPIAVSQDADKMDAKSVSNFDCGMCLRVINEYEAYLRTLANFGGTLQQAKELAAKALTLKTK